MCNHTAPLTIFIVKSSCQIFPLIKSSHICSLTPQGDSCQCKTLLISPIRANPYSVGQLIIKCIRVSHANICWSWQHEVLVSSHYYNVETHTEQCSHSNEVSRTCCCIFDLDVCAPIVFYNEMNVRLTFLLLSSKLLSLWEIDLSSIFLITENTF